MTYDQYQQLYGAAKEQIAARVDKIQPRAGNGASVLGMGIAVEVPVREVVIRAVDPPSYFILFWINNAFVKQTVGDLERASRVSVDHFGFGDFGLTYPVDPKDKPLKLSMQFLVFNRRFGYLYAFPVRVTLVQYSENVDQNQVYRRDPIRTVSVDLRREPVTVEFYNDLADFRPQGVILTRVEKI